TPLGHVVGEGSISIKAINTTTNARHSSSELAVVFSVVYQHYRNALLALWRALYFRCLYNV
ncbi:hypothetical protein, partial [Photobacterium sanguinicancri]|uniref:hypothetical protein n=1 Tax=Photobacterium sanguinicancri TaxID=875932 RepID=UPI0024804AC8